MSTLPVMAGEGAPRLSIPWPALIVIAEAIVVHALVAAPRPSAYAARTTALAGTLAGVEMGLKLAGVPHQPGGAQAAFDVLAAAAAPASA